MEFQFNNLSCDYDTVAGCGKDAVKSNQDPWFEMDDCSFMDLLSSVFGQESNMANHHEAVSDDCMQHDHSDDSIQASPSELIGTPVDDKPNSVSLAPMETLNNYSKGFAMPRDETMDDLRNGTNGCGRELSTEEILRIAGERFIQFSTNKVDGISMFINPYGPSLSGLSIDEARDVELVNLLLSGAENVRCQQYDVAAEIISRCRSMTSDFGTPVQRIAFYFTEALQEKIRREFGMIITEKDPTEVLCKRLALGTNNTFLATFQKLPFVQVMQFAGVQAIIENVKTDGKIHLIDLQIRSGIQWTALMQGLAECTIQHLKITAVGTSDQRFIEETGKRLTSFAQSLKLPFTFNAVYLTDMMDFREELLNIETDETVVFYSYLMLRSMLSRSDCLENLMRAIARCKPALMVVTEVEANTNSPSFVQRFIEALFFYGVFFDCLDDSLGRDDQSRIMLECAYSREGILNIVAADGQERVTRDVKVHVWRAFLARFGMTEIELSESSRYQASLVLKRFAQGKSCTLDSNGKGLVVGWKGTPLHSLTIWKFS